MKPTNRKAKRTEDAALVRAGKMRRFDLVVSGHIRSEVRFADLVSQAAQDQRECWMWPGQRNALGYGLFSHKLAHRVVFERFVGPIPEGLELDHLCSTPACVNPWHLEPVTHAENLRRGQGFAGINSRKTHCANGHEYTPETTRITAQGQRKCRVCWGRKGAA